MDFNAETWTSPPPIFACGKNPHDTPKLLDLFNTSTFFAFPRVPALIALLFFEKSGKMHAL